MKTRLLNQDAALLLGIASATVLAATSPALEIVASSFGGCGISGSASFSTLGSSHPGAPRPAGCPPGKGPSFDLDPVVVEQQGDAKDHLAAL